MAYAEVGEECSGNEARDALRDCLLRLIPSSRSLSMFPAVVAVCNALLCLADSPGLVYVDAQLRLLRLNEMLIPHDKFLV